VRTSRSLRSSPPVPDSLRKRPVTSFLTTTDTLPMINTNATLTLNGQSYPLRWDFAAIYRLWEAGLNSSLDSLGEDVGNLKALIDVLWACLPEQAHEALAARPEGDKPVSLAGLLSKQGVSMDEFAEILGKVFAVEVPEKKTATSTSPSPASS